MRCGRRWAPAFGRDDILLAYRIPSPHSDPADSHQSTPGLQEAYRMTHARLRHLNCIALLMYKYSYEACSRDVMICPERRSPYHEIPLSSGNPRQASRWRAYWGGADCSHSTCHLTRFLDLTRTDQTRPLRLRKAPASNRRATDAAQQDQHAAHRPVVRSAPLARHRAPGRRANDIYCAVHCR